MSKRGRPRVANSNEALATVTQKEVEKRKRELLVQRLLGDPFRALTEDACHASFHQHRKANCSQNPNCLYGIGERKRGIWKEKETILNKIGDSPRSTYRDLNAQKVIPSGLVNLGATCYVNSLLQCMFFDIHFRYALYKWSPKDDPYTTNAKGSSIPSFSCTSSLTELERNIVEEMRLVFAYMQFGEQCAYNPVEFINKLKVSTGEQQDAQEFNKLLLTMLERIFSFAKVKTGLHDFIPKRYGGSIRYCTKCRLCGQVSSRETPFYELELQINHHESVRESLCEYFSTEVLTGDNQYFCDRPCNKKCDADRYVEIATLPDVLNLQLMRFVYDTNSYQKKKVKNPILIPLKLTSDELLGESSRTKESTVYDLCAVLYHRGSTANSGHYVADVRDTNGTWWSCNDQVVVEKKWGDIIKSSATKRTKISKSRSKTTKEGQSSLNITTVEVTDTEGSAQYFGHPSQNAYMLVYRRRYGVLSIPLVTGTVSMDTPSENIALPDHVMHKVIATNENHRSSISDYNVKRAELEKLIDGRVLTYRAAFLDWASAESSRGGKPPFLTKEDVALGYDFVKEHFVWVPTTWLSQFVSGAPIAADIQEVHESTSFESSVEAPVSKLGGANVGHEDCKGNKIADSIVFDKPPNFQSIACSHSTRESIKFSPQHVFSLKLVRRSNLEILLSGSKTVSSSAFDAEECDVCSKAFRKRLSSMRSKLDRYAELSRLIKQSSSQASTMVSGEGHAIFCLSKAWQKQFSSKLTTLERQERCLLEGKPIKKSSGSLRGFLFFGDEAAAVNHDDDDNINAGITCEHGFMVPESNKHTLVSKQVWLELTKIFPKSVPFKQDTVCTACLSASKEGKAAITKQKQIHNSRISLFESHKPLKVLKGRNSGCPRKSKNSTVQCALDFGSYRLVNRVWLHSWREYFKSYRNKEPGVMQHSPCLCLCSNPGTLLPSSFERWLQTDGFHNYFDYINFNPGLCMSEQDNAFEIIREDEWDVLSLYYPGSISPVLVTVDRGDSDASAVIQCIPSVCSTCLNTKKGTEQIEKMTYSSRQIVLVKLKHGLRLSEFLANETRRSDGSVRRSKRSKSAGNRKVVLASFDDSISMLKMKAIEQFPSLEDTNLGHMLFYTKSGQKLSNYGTLVENKIYAGDELFLCTLVDDDPDAEDIPLADVFSGVNGTQSKPSLVERGFAGSVFHQSKDSGLSATNVSIDLTSLENSPSPSPKRRKKEMEPSPIPALRRGGLGLPIDVESDLLHVDTFSQESDVSECY